MGRAVWMLESVTPAAAQRPETAGAISRVLCQFVCFGLRWGDGEDALASSSALHREGVHWRSEFVMAWLPVVHWHLMSDRLQPEPRMAVAKQGIYIHCVSFLVAIDVT